MQRLQAVNPESASGKVKDLLDSVQTKLGMTPNIIRTMANSPAVLQAYLGFGAALGTGALSARLREQIALVVAETNKCDYCLAAHAAIGKSVGLSEEAILNSRRAESSNGKEEAALRFAGTIVRERGRARNEDLAHLRQAGYGDGEIAEIVANVAINLFTNYFNHVAGTEVDFPKVGDLVPVSECRM